MDYFASQRYASFYPVKIIQTCTARKKKFRFQLVPETQYLLMTVMLIEAKQ
jgi:hypothetical protein